MPYYPIILWRQLQMLLLPKKIDCHLVDVSVNKPEPVYCLKKNMPGFSLITYLVYFAIYIQIKNRSQYYILFLCVSCNKYFFIDHFKLFVELISRDQIIFLKVQEIQNLKYYSSLFIKGMYAFGYNCPRACPWAENFLNKDNGLSLGYT